MLTITDLTYRLGERTLIEQASAFVPDGARCGLVGRNGTGKTTLFRLLTGEIQPESGSIELRRGARIGQVAQEAPGTERSLLETVLDADTERSTLLREADIASDPDRIADIHARLADIDAHTAEARAGTILHGLGFDAEAQRRPCSSFSGGWRMRVALAAVLFTEPDLLLLDEPTNYLDLEGTLWLENYVSRYRHTVVVISHDRDLLDKVCNRIIHLDARKLISYTGNYSTFARLRAERAGLEAKQKSKQDARKAELQRFIDRFKAKATKARQAQSRVKMLAKMEDIAVTTDEDVAPLTFPSPERAVSSPIVNLARADVGYGKRPVLRGLDLRIDADDRIALLGSNGNGKSTFAKLVADRLQPMEGEVVRAPKLRVAMFAQHNMDDLRPQENAIEHVRRAMSAKAKAEGRTPPGEGQVRSAVARMGLPTAKMHTEARDLSGGEKARLLLGLATMDRPHLLILDEPTNHLDVETRDALTRALNAFEGAVIVISHDRSLVEASAERLWLVADGGVRAFDGDMEDYRRYVLTGAEPKHRDEPPAPKRPDRAERAVAREAKSDLRKRVKQLDVIMAKATGAIAKLDDLLVTAAKASDSGRIADLSRKRSEFERRLVEVEEEWLKATEELEA